jgi:hypothetical protein
MFRNVLPIALLFVCAALPSCGGGGGGESPTPAPVPAPTPAPPPPPPTIPPLAQPPIDISGETTFLGVDHWGTNSAVNGGHGETIDGVPCGIAVQTFHIHSHLSVMLDGQLLTIPAHIGIIGSTPTFGGCTYQIHTHDGSGRLHIEGSVPVAYNLGNFFDIWGQPLSSDNVGGITGLPIVIYITENTGVTTIYQGDPRAIDLTSHRLITFQVGTPITEIPNFTWSLN